MVQLVRGWCSCYCGGTVGPGGDTLGTWVIPLVRGDTVGTGVIKLVRGGTVSTGVIHLVRGGIFDTVVSLVRGAIHLVCG